nr:hypothetical protein [Tanacetum cinerariifolium]
MSNQEDLCRMMLARRGRQPKLRFCLKMGIFGIYRGYSGAIARGVASTLRNKPRRRLKSWRAIKRDKA